MAHAWKACWVKALRGSNPLSSAHVLSRDPVHERVATQDFFVVWRSPTRLARRPCTFAGARKSPDCYHTAGARRMRSSPITTSVPRPPGRWPGAGAVRDRQRRDGISEVGVRLRVACEPIRFAGHRLLLGLAQRREADLVGRYAGVGVGAGKLLAEGARDNSPRGNFVPSGAQEGLLAGSLLRYVVSEVLTVPFAAHVHSHQYNG